MSERDDIAIDLARLDLWWAVPGRLAGMSLPFVDPLRYESPSANLYAFRDDLPALWCAGIRAVVCLLNMPSAARAYTDAGFAFQLAPIPDGDAPSDEQFARIRSFIAEQLQLDHPVVVHCEAGVGRTGTVLAGHLITSGISFRQAVAQIRHARPGAIETMRQILFLQGLEETA